MKKRGRKATGTIFKRNALSTPEEIKLKREYFKEYYKKNRNMKCYKSHEYDPKRYQEKKEMYKEIQYRWVEKNREHYNEYQRNYQKEKGFYLLKNKSVKERYGFSRLWNYVFKYGEYVKNLKYITYVIKANGKFYICSTKNLKKSIVDKTYNENMEIKKHIDMDPNWMFSIFYEYDNKNDSKIYRDKCIDFLKSKGEESNILNIYVYKKNQ